MKSQFVLALIVVTCGAAALAAPASYQSTEPEQAPIFIRRARRDVGGKISSNPSGGADAVLQATQKMGSDAANLAATAFAAGNTNKGPVATGGSVGVNL